MPLKERCPGEGFWNAGRAVAFSSPPAHCIAWANVGSSIGTHVLSQVKYGLASGSITSLMWVGDKVNCDTNVGTTAIAPSSLGLE